MKTVKISIISFLIILLLTFIGFSLYEGFANKRVPFAAIKDYISGEEINNDNLNNEDNQNDNLKFLDGKCFIFNEDSSDIYTGLYFNNGKMYDAVVKFNKENKELRISNWSKIKNLGLDYKFIQIENLILIPEGLLFVYEENIDSLKLFGSDQKFNNCDYQTLLYCDENFDVI